MSQPIPSASPALAALIERAVARVRHALPADAPWPEGVEHPLARVALASDFVVDTLARQPALLAHLAQSDPPPLPVPRLDPAQPGSGPHSCAVTAQPPPRVWSGATCSAWTM